MQTPLVVPDASVLLKWVLPSDDEPDGDKALLLRAAIQDDAVHALLPTQHQLRLKVRFRLDSVRDRWHRSRAQNS